MPAAARLIAEADRAAARSRLEIGEELRQGRHNAGLSLRAVGAFVGCSPSTVSRLERGLVREAPMGLIWRCASLVGLTARVNLYPSDRSVRDIGQLRVLKRLRKHVGPAWQWLIEMPVSRGDLRAFDAGLVREGCRVGVDAWSRMRDAQAQVRSSMRKQEDSGVDRLVLVFADTPHNRRALREAEAVLRPAFPLSTRRLLGALRSGRDPGANGIVLI